MKRATRPAIRGTRPAIRATRRQFLFWLAATTTAGLLALDDGPPTSLPLAGPVLSRVEGGIEGSQG